MFKELTFTTKKGKDIKVNAITFTYHDLPNGPGTKMVRATTHAILTEGGDIYIGCSVASEADNFVKKEGRERAEDLAVDSLNRNLCSGHIDLTDEHTTPVLNKMLAGMCLEYELEKFRQMLSDRAAIIEGLEDEINMIETDYSLGLGMHML